jgi:PilZ domain-containing protein
MYAKMVTDRRASRRYLFETPLRVRLWKSNVPEERGVSKDLSEQGIFFTARLPLEAGSIVEILLEMPQEMTGEPTTEWRCTGEVVRVQALDPAGANLGLGVRFDGYSVARRQKPEKSCRDSTPERLS